MVPVGLMPLSIIPFLHGLYQPFQSKILWCILPVMYYFIEARSFIILYIKIGKANRLIK